MPRGSAFGGDRTLTVDVQARYAVPRFNKYLRQGLNFRVEVFNIFNTSSVTQLDEIGDVGAAQASTTYGQPLVYQKPRCVRFGFDLVY